MPPNRRRHKRGNKTEHINNTQSIIVAHTNESKEEKECKEEEEKHCNVQCNKVEKTTTNTSVYNSNSIVNSNDKKKREKNGFHIALYANMPFPLLALDNMCKKLDHTNNNTTSNNFQRKGTLSKREVANNNTCTSLNTNNKNSSLKNIDSAVIKVSQYNKESNSDNNNNNNRNNVNASCTWTNSLCREFTWLPHAHGMLNSSNFCFINSIVQVLIYTPPLAQLVISVVAFPTLFAEEVAHQAWWGNNVCKICPTITALAKWFTQYWKAGTSRQTLAAPKLPFTLDSKSARYVDGTAQQDAHEFLQKLLEMINDELYSFECLLREHDYGQLFASSKEEIQSVNKCNNDSNSISSKGITKNKKGDNKFVVNKNGCNGDGDDEDDELKGWTFVGGKEKLSIREARVDGTHSRLIEQLFGGRLETHINGTQKSQNHTSVLVEHFYSFPVDVGFAAWCTIEDAIERTCMTEHIYDSEREKNLRKTLRFRTLPHILILHLRRWTITREGELVKLDNHVKFGKTLVIPHNVCAINNMNKQARTYHLLSAVAHRGVSLMQGHYVTYLAEHVANPLTSTHSNVSSTSCTNSELDSSHVVLCNDAKVSICNVAEMYNEPVYFLIYQKVIEEESGNK